MKNLTNLLEKQIWARPLALSHLIRKRIVSKKSAPLSTVMSNHIFYYPTPANLTYNWSFGSLVGLFFARQLITGIFLARHYTPHVSLAFSSVEHIRSDVSGGATFRYFHANGASSIFILMYFHRARNLYYQSYLTRSTLWYSGLVIFLLRIATAFIGYVLPWGQISFWGATVITSLVTAIPYIGEDIAYWVWGGFSINNATLTRFFSIHYLLPFLITGLILTHLTLLHVTGSSDPLTLSITPEKVTFHPYFSLKDGFILLFAFSVFGLLALLLPNILGHADNFLPANPLVTPAHIVPEWYFTPFYAILRACPNKIGGALGRFGAIIILFFVPALVDRGRGNVYVFASYTTAHKVGFWVFVGIFLRLRFLGSRAAAEPYVVASKVFTVLYFAYFVVFLPRLSVLGEQILVDKQKSTKKQNRSWPKTPLVTSTTFQEEQEAQYCGLWFLRFVWMLLAILLYYFGVFPPSRELFGRFGHCFVECGLKVCGPMFALRTVIAARTYAFDTAVAYWRRRR